NNGTAHRAFGDGFAGRVVLRQEISILLIGIRSQETDIITVNADLYQFLNCVTSILYMVIKTNNGFHGHTLLVFQFSLVVWLVVSLPAEVRPRPVTCLPMRSLHLGTMMVI